VTVGASDLSKSAAHIGRAEELFFGEFSPGNFFGILRIDREFSGW